MLLSHNTPYILLGIIIFLIFLSAGILLRNHRKAKHPKTDSAVTHEEVYRMK